MYVCGECPWGEVVRVCVRPECLSGGVRMCLRRECPRWEMAHMCMCMPRAYLSARAAEPANPTRIQITPGICIKTRARPGSVSKGRTLEPVFIMCPSGF